MIEQIKITECPRDAIQGLRNFIPTHLKVEYINTLLKVGFDTLDFGSFVSPKAIPQMRDTTHVLEQLDLASSSSKLLAIIPYKCGYDEVDACQYSEITYVGFPLSISETFQLKNVRSTFEDSFLRVAEIQDGLKDFSDKELLVYISMAFGNPYGDPWNIDIIHSTVSKLNDLGVRIIALSDTVGLSKPKDIETIFKTMIAEYPEIQFGAHFHTTPTTWEEKIDAAFTGGCRRFDGALQGFGGCPLSGYDLVGNMPTENLIAYFTDKGIELNLNMDEFHKAQEIAPKVFTHNPIYIPPTPYYNF